MHIIRIEKHDNGGHDNQVSSVDFPVPEGWAIVPEEVGTPDTMENYPFGDITVETKYRYSVEINGEIKSVLLDERTDKKGMDEEIIHFVTSWTPLPVPEPEPAPEPAPTMEDVVKTLIGG